MSRRRRLLAIGGAVLLVAVFVGGGWEYHRLATYRPLSYLGGESGGSFWKVGSEYQIPDGAPGPFGGREAEVIPVGRGPAWFGFSIHNSGDYAVTVTGLAGPTTSDAAGHLRIIGLLLPDGYQGPANDGIPGVGPPRPFRPVTVPAHAYRWIGFQFATTNCDGITGARRFVIGTVAVRIHYLHFFDAVNRFAPPFVAVATCGPFHPVLDP